MTSVVAVTMYQLIVGCAMLKYPRNAGTCNSKPCKLAAGGLRSGVCAMPLRKLCAPQLLRNWGCAMANFSH